MVLVFKLVKTVEFEGLPATADAIKPPHVEACYAMLTCGRAQGSACTADLPLRLTTAKGGTVAIMTQIHKQASKPVRLQAGRLPPPEWKTSRTFASCMCSCTGGVCEGARAMMRTSVVFRVQHCGESCAQAVAPRTACCDGSACARTDHPSHLSSHTSIF
jgi:hypothetical protein